MVKRSLHNIEIALEAIKTNKLKSILTALGILFGVSAVISMMAIGNGARQHILRQMETIGANNIVIEAVEKKELDSKDEEDDNENADKQSSQISPGLHALDYHSIKSIVPTINKISPEVIIESTISHSNKRIDGQCIGVSNDYFDIYNLNLESGAFFNQKQAVEGQSVCILGGNIATKLFSNIDPIGKYIKFGNIWLKVAGVIENRNLHNIDIEEYGFNNLNEAVFVPQNTVIRRIIDRNKINFTPPSNSSLQLRNFSINSNNDSEQNNYHQFDRIIIQVNNSEDLRSTASLTERILKRRHNNIEDYKMIIPELLLKQKQETNEMFNFVLGAIAGISLLVGGIGIMNIMFATVLERIREIGIRMAIGAKKTDIMEQFMIEAVFISLIGGILGIITGVSFAWIINRLTDIETYVTLSSILIAFLVSVSTGIIFGYSPAKRAAEKDPIESLRHE
ncbi:MAG: ABC transporter permease [Bacteroidales bacterium]